jgi:predicted ATP-grasp superfamily ATP-dependent carboligase
MSRTEPPRAIVIGSGVVSLGVIIDLAIDGVHVIHISPKTDDLALRSRWPQEKFILDSSDDRFDQLFEVLDANSARWKSACLIPTTDPLLRLVSKNLGRIRHNYVTPVIPWSALRGIVNKGLLYATAAASGIPTPQIRYGSALDNVDTWIEDLSFPVIVKPSETPRFFAKFQSKVLYAESAAQLRHHLDAVRRHQLDVMVSEIIPGTQTDLKAYRCYIDQTGTVLAEMCSEKLRSHPPEFGVGIVQRTIPMHETLQKQGRKLLRELDFTGFATVEFKHDARDGSLKLMEINPRPAMVQRLFRKAGINFAKLTVDDLTGREVSPRNQYRAGVYAIHNSADLYHLRRFARQGLPGLRQFFRPYLAARKALLLPPIRDPAPFLYDVRRIIAGRFARNASRTDVQT